MMHGISLCSGIGGLDLGISLAVPDYKAICYIEREAYPAAILVTRMQEGTLSEAPIWDSIETFRGKPWRGKVDIITAGFPCFTAGTMVLSEHGYVPIEDICIGDRVLSHTGEWRKVISVSKRKDIPTRGIYVTGTPEIRTTDEHPFWATYAPIRWDNSKRAYRRYREAPRWTPTKCLTKDHYIAQVLPRHTIDDDKSTGYYWVIGKYLADGWRVRRRGRKIGRIVICANKVEAEEVEKKIRAAGFAPCKSNERTTTRFHILNKHLYCELAKYGKYAHGKRIPRQALQLPEYKARSLIDGYLSGDGWREDTNRGYSGWRATTTSKSLALGIALLAQRAYGTIASVRKGRIGATARIEGREVRTRQEFRLAIPDRNRSCYRTGRTGWKLIRNIRSTRKSTVYNIQVEKDASYIVENCVVHNCPPVSVAGRRKGTEDERWLWPEVIRIVREVKPEWVFLENVRGLLSVESGRAFAGILRDLARAGYDAEWMLLSAADLGAPHRRERIFILGHSRGMGLSGFNWGRTGQEPENGHSQLADSVRAGGSEIPGGPHGDEKENERRSPEHHNLPECGDKGMADTSSIQHDGQMRPRTGRAGSANESEPVADPDGGGRGREGLHIRSGEQGESKAIPHEPEPDDTLNERLEGHGGDVINGRESGRNDPGPDRPAWPPSPDDVEGWKEILQFYPELAPAIESRIRGMVNGPSVWADQLRALGNSVVPVVAAKAFITLRERFNR